MPPTEQAQRNHDELFPGEGNLDARTRLMVQLAALIACQALGEYRVMLARR
jgi:4-carboxymuconolactone decarboxylase